MNEKSKITFSILAAFLGIATIVDAVFMFGVMEVYYPILLIIGAVLISLESCHTCNRSDS